MADKSEVLDTDKVIKMSDMVKFKVAYPKDFKGDKYLNDGDVLNLHKNHAEDLQDRVKIGSIQ